MNQSRDTLKCTFTATLRQKKCRVFVTQCGSTPVLSPDELSVDSLLYQQRLCEYTRSPNEMTSRTVTHGKENSLCAKTDLGSSLTTNTLNLAEQSPTIPIGTCERGGHPVQRSSGTCMQIGRNRIHDRPRILASSKRQARTTRQVACPFCAALPRRATEGRREETTESGYCRITPTQGMNSMLRNWLVVLSTLLALTTASLAADRPMQ